MRELLGGIGENVEIDTPFHCDHGNNIFIGNNVIIGINCTFVDNAEIRIGNRVLIASNVQFYTSSHRFCHRSAWRRTGKKREQLFQDICAPDRNKG